MWGEPTLSLESHKCVYDVEEHLLVLAHVTLILIYSYEPDLLENRYVNQIQEKLIMLRKMINVETSGTSTLRPPDIEILNPPLLMRCIF